MLYVTKETRGKFWQLKCPLILGVNLLELHSMH